MIKYSLSLRLQLLLVVEISFGGHLGQGAVALIALLLITLGKHLFLELIYVFCLVYGATQRIDFTYYIISGGLQILRFLNLIFYFPLKVLIYVLILASLHMKKHTTHSKPFPQSTFSS